VFNDGSGTKPAPGPPNHHNPGPTPHAADTDGVVIMIPIYEEKNPVKSSLAMMGADAPIPPKRALPPPRRAPRGGIKRKINTYFPDVLV